MKKGTKLAAAFALAATTSLAGCDLSGVIDDVKEQIAGALNVDPSSLQKLLAQSSKSFSVAGEQVSGNLSQMAGGGQRAGTTPGGAPAFGAKADGAACETVDKSEADGKKTAIVNYDACPNRKGQVKVVISKDDDDIISEMTYTAYSENAEDATNYVYFDGDMKWTMKMDGDKMSVASNNAYTTKFAGEGTVHTLFMTESLDLSYENGGLVIDGTNTISEGDKTAILTFGSVTFDPAVCPKGPSDGKINLKVGSNFVEVTITDCAEAIMVVSKDGEQTTTNMTAADLDAFFKEFAGNLNTFDQQMDTTAGKVGGIGALANCTLDPTGEMAQFGGVWCAGFPASGTQAYLFCRQVCNVAADKQHPDYFMLEGIGSWSGNVESDAPYGYIEPSALTVSCLDRSYVYEHGLVKYGQSVPDLNFTLDVVNIVPDMSFGYEGDMGDQDAPPLAPGDPAEEFSYPAAWSVSGNRLDEYSAMSVMNGTPYDFAQEFLVFAFSKTNQSTVDCTPEQMETLFSGDIQTGGGGQDYCVEYPDDPYCTGGEDPCLLDPYGYDCDPMMYCDANHSDYRCGEWLCDDYSPIYSYDACYNFCTANPSDSWCY